MTHSRDIARVFDDGATRAMGAAYALACDTLEARSDSAADRALRDEIAAALLEAAEDRLRDAPALAQAAIDLVCVDSIEVDFS